MKATKRCLILDWFRYQFEIWWYAWADAVGRRGQAVWQRAEEF